MSQELLIAIIAGLGGMLGWGLADFFAKKTIDKIGDVATLFWSLFIGIFPLLILFAYNPLIPEKLENLGYTGILYLAILGAWSGLSYIPTYIGFGKGKVALLSPIFASYAAVVVILSASFLGEVISPGQVLSLAIVFTGVLLISGDLRRLFLIIFFRAGEREEVQGLKEILIAILFYSPWLITLGLFINGEYWVPYLLGIRIFAALALFLYARARGISLAVRNSSLWKFLVLIGCADVAAFAFLSWGYSATSYVSIVTMLSAAFSLPVIILARIFLKERPTRVQTAGSLIIVLGVMLLPLL